MEKRIRILSLFALLVFAGCADTTISGLNGGNTSKESSAQAVSEAETGSGNEATEGDEALIFADEDMERYVRKLIGKEEGELSPIDVESVDALYLGNKDISAIDGIEHFTNLRTLHLNQTEVSDISALAGLTQLEYLDISHSRVEDVAALANLTKLKTLYLKQQQFGRPQTTG